MASAIEDYGLIGNLRTAAVVSTQGSVDWFCAPRFDSDACFASLIGYDEHGRWMIRPTVQVRDRKPRYRGDTLILETEVICDGGSYRLIDFMPVEGERTDLIRIVEGIEGEVPLEMILNPQFGFGAYQPWITKKTDGFSLVAGPDAVFARADVPLESYARGVHAVFSVKKGERLSFQLTWHSSHLNPPPAINAETELKATEKFWLNWSGRCKYQGKWKDAVMRSLITLKALSYAPTGAIVAAPTTSLPEDLGGVRNWDYRFCWLRDASLTLHSLMAAGYVDETTAFRDWLLNSIAGDPSQTQIMYTIDGGRRLTEYELDSLPGYEGSRPVRIGNAASDQFQLDVYGEALNAIYLGRKMGLPAARADAIGPAMALIRHIARVWQHPDDGIWEVRGGRRHFTYSKVMAWVAIDRAVRLHEEFGFRAPESEALLPHLRGLRERIHDEVCQRGFHPKVKAFTQSYGSEVLDASSLLIPHMGFLPPTDERVIATVRATERELLRDGLVLRYENKHGLDGLPGSEGAFLACSFWLADNYWFLGLKDRAEELFERLLSLRNPLGLLAEEYDSPRRRQIGNFPQGFSHLALVTTANYLSKPAVADLTGVWKNKAA